MACSTRPASSRPLLGLLNVWTSSYMVFIRQRIILHLAPQFKMAGWADKSRWIPLEALPGRSRDCVLGTRPP